MLHAAQLAGQEIPDFPQLLIEHQLWPLSAHCKRVAVIATYPPTLCGIATFTGDTVAALKSADPDMTVDVYALRDGCLSGDTSSVKGYINAVERSSYRLAAEAIEASVPDAVWVQHEFGLFGGEAGEWLIDLLAPLSAPLIVTLHTVLDKPDAAQRKVMNWLVDRASRLIVMSREGEAILQRVYGADAKQIELIPHGVPDRPFGRSAEMKARLGLQNRKILLTFGLLSPGKGLETAIAALPQLVRNHPGILYCIAGATHPKLLAHEGETYRNALIAQATQLGVTENIHWIDRYLDIDELLDLIEAADIYLTPYHGEAQSTSGTLAYALALGKAVVSTPFKHARELLGNETGLLVPFADPLALGGAVDRLLADEDLLTAMQRRAYRLSRQNIWPEFGRRSLSVLRKTAIAFPEVELPANLPQKGLLRLCDDTGMAQHSILSVVDRKHGYCIDDNARALMLANVSEGRFGELAPTFAAFIQHGWNSDTTRFRNFMGYDRNWLEDEGSQDSHGRTLWALGSTVADAKSADLSDWAAKLFDLAAPTALDFQSPRAIAFAMIGADRLLERNEEHEGATQLLKAGARRLGDALRAHSRSGWIWFENTLAYDNARLPEALLRAGIRLRDKEADWLALKALKWLIGRQTASAGHFRPVGSHGFGREQSGALPFDQQAVDAWASIDAALLAYVHQPSRLWLQSARAAYGWFFGQNDRGAILAQFHDGSCCDGITSRGVNRNQGAESALALHFAAASMRKLNDYLEGSAVDSDNLWTSPV